MTTLKLRPWTEIVRLHPGVQTPNTLDGRGLPAAGYRRG